MDPRRLIARRMEGIDASGIRRVFDLGRTLKDPINLSIGQPDFPVPEAMKSAAIQAIRQDANGYTPTQGIEPLRERIARHLLEDVGWSVGERTGLLVTSGTSGALMLAAMCLLDAGDEMIIADPYFVMYPHLAGMCGARAIVCDTYPDFVLTAERVEPLLTARTKFVLLNSPGNPSGAVASRAEVAALLDLCRRRGVLLISDEIYDAFTFSECRTERSAGGSAGGLRCPSPARQSGASEDVLLIRGFGKGYGATGWRMGYAAGPRAIIEEMAKLQQYTFVCAPSIVQHGCVPALDIDMGEHIDEYEARRDRVVSRLRDVTDLTTPGGAFYAFVRIPERLGISATEFVNRCVQRNLLVIPGGVFSRRDTHFRLSFATKRESLERGLDVLVDLMR